jgi:branched-chain amino acid transport system substrate-binding protein
MEEGKRRKENGGRKMDKKLVLLMIPLLVISFMGLSVRTFGVTPIKIGIIGPYYLPQWGGTLADPTSDSAQVGGGMWPGANLAAREINAAGGINVGGVMTPIQLIPANEWAYDPSTQTYNVPNAIQSVTTLLGQGAQFIIGGFRTEVTIPITETVMAWNQAHTPVPFFISGASYESNVTATKYYLCENLTDPATYNTYKWLFRVTPVNGTILFKELLGYLAGYLVPNKLAKMYGTSATNPLKYAIVAEDLTWADQLVGLLSLGPYVGLANTTCVGVYRTPSGTNDYTSILNDIQNKGAHLIVDIYTLPDVENMFKQINTLGYKDLVVGIDVFGQLQAHWAATNNGGCQYEVGLNYAGTGSPIVPGYTDVFWNNFVGNYTGAWPIYTAAGAYDALYGLKAAIESAGTTDPNVLLPFIQNTHRNGVDGKFQYDVWQDVYSQSTGPLWPDGFARSMVVQWVNGSLFTPAVSGGVMTVVTPIDQSYSRKTLIPPQMYPYSTWDLNYDGKVNMADVGAAAKAFGTKPGDTRYNFEADTNVDGKIDMKDIGAVAKNFGKTQSPWPLPQ